jgi:hypothetical protein
MRTGLVAVLAVCAFASFARGQELFIRGDVDGSGRVDTTDGVQLLGALFTGDLPPVCFDAADVNDDGRVTVEDQAYLVRALFLGDEKIPAPYPEPGLDPTADPLACKAQGPVEAPPELTWTFALGATSVEQGASGALVLSVGSVMPVVHPMQSFSAVIVFPQGGITITNVESLGPQPVKFFFDAAAPVDGLWSMLRLVCPGDGQTQIPMGPLARISFATPPTVPPAGKTIELKFAPWAPPMPPCPAYFYTGIGSNGLFVPLDGAPGTIVIGAGVETFVRGDANGDGAADITDVARLVAWLKGIGPRPPCYDAADVDDDGLITSADLVYLRRFLYEGMAAPPPPYPAAGPDPTVDGITCNSYAPRPVLGPVDADVRFGLRTGAGLPGEEVRLPLTLRTLAPLRGMTVVLSWDPALLEFVGIVREGPETMDAALAAQVFDAWGEPAQGWAAVELSFQTNALFPTLATGAMDAVIGYARFLIRPDAPAPQSAKVILPENLQFTDDRPGRVYSIAILADGTVVNPRTIPGAVAIMAPTPEGGRLVVQDVAVPIDGLADAPLTELAAVAAYDTGKGEGTLTFATGAKDFPFCFFPAQVGSVILRSIAYVHGVAMPGAARLADCTDAPAIILQVDEEYPIEKPKNKKAPFNGLGSLRVTLRMSTASPTVEAIVADFSKLDWQRLVCPAAPYTYEWSDVGSASPLLTEHAGDLYVGWDATSGNRKEFYNYRRLTVKCVPAGGLFDTAKIKDQVFTVGANYDPDTGAADFIAVVLPNDHAEFTRGDANLDGAIDIADPIHILAYLFAHEPLKSSKDAADVNDDGALDIGDAITLLAYLHALDVPTMVKAPFWAMQPFKAKPGKDPTTDGL